MYFFLCYFLVKILKDFAVHNIWFMSRFSYVMVVYNVRLCCYLRIFRVCTHMCYVNKTATLCGPVFSFEMNNATIISQVLFQAVFVQRSVVYKRGEARNCFCYVQNRTKKENIAWSFHLRKKKERNLEFTQFLPYFFPHKCQKESHKTAICQTIKLVFEYEKDISTPCNCAFFEMLKTLLLE